MTTSEAGLRRRRVLIVEDERAISDLLRLYLSREGFGVHVATDGPSGLQAARTLHPAAIILDVGLPGISGFETLRQIRARSDVPVIMVTAKTEEGSRVSGLEGRRVSGVQLCVPGAGRARGARPAVRHAQPHAFMAHIHVGAPGTNGPIAVSGIQGASPSSKIRSVNLVRKVAMNDVTASRKSRIAASARMRCISLAMISRRSASS